jgi:hypothetical protein
VLVLSLKGAIGLLVGLVVAEIVNQRSDNSFGFSLGENTSSQREHIAGSSAISKEDHSDQEKQR